MPSNFTMPSDSLPAATLSSADMAPLATRLLGVAQHLATQNLPAFGATLRQVLQITDDGQASMQAIAQIILKDPVLTAKMLRQANSAEYRRGGCAPIATVTRALVLLGVQAVRSMCAAVLVVQTVDSGVAHPRRVQVALGHALHAAVQAKALTLRQHFGPERAERAFVDALLSNIGELSFWVVGGAQADALDAELTAGAEQQKAELAVLGFSLRNLSAALLRHWGLAPSLNAEASLAVEVATESGKGWNTPALQEIIRTIGAKTGESTEQALRHLRDNAKEAARLAVLHGAQPAVQGMPVVAEADPGRVPRELVPDLGHREPDAAQQLAVLGEMLKARRNKGDLAQLLGICLEGMTRTVGLDRVVFSLLAKDRKSFAARLALGPSADELTTRFRASCDLRFESRLRAAGAEWMRIPADQPRAIREAGGAQECLVGPVCLHDQLIGFFFTRTGCRLPENWTRPFTRGFVCLPNRRKCSWGVDGNTALSGNR